MSESKQNLISKLAEEGEDFVVAPPSASAKSLSSFIRDFRDIQNDIPWVELEELSWIAPGERNLKSVFPYLWQHANSETALFRKSTTEDRLQITLWRSRVNQLATEILTENPTVRFSPEKFDLEQVAEVAKLSREEGSINTLPDYLLSKGIVLVYVRALKGLKLDGIVYRTASGIPVVAVSFRFPRLDNFWFTLLHELCHVALHYDYLDNAIIEELEGVKPVERIEKQANQAAKRSIVPRYIWERCNLKYHPVADSVYELAENMGVHPSLIAGLARRELNDFSKFTDIVNSENPRTIVFGVD